ncbi:phosphoglycerate mutase [Desulfolithobacter dissulfuricans]|uniref:Phosphoglycerate mutase n=1 Tax=Desulfolithobacter dissulfuricans TaxID=2795293 RepID=A0A915U3Q4_9BACT|nr:alkaline phosphatase family protein [Desulfolithobacter dissulfuricans]BCO10786.1 phosphoglycerate mutase [Desulfolithobacter dissulfuricans]
MSPTSPSIARRCVLILLDGLGDRAHGELNDATPLQAARTPNLDSLAAMGSSGLLHASRPGRVLPSENAHFAIFGYSADEFPGRGFLEALGAEIAIAPEEVALLAHFAALQESDNLLLLEKDRPEASDEEAALVTGAIESFSTDQISFRYVQTGHLDGVVLLNGPVSPHITDSQCFAEGEPLVEVQPLRTGGPRAARTARALKTYLLWCKRVLDAHPVNLARKEKGLVPVNGLVTQRAGQWKRVEPFSLRWGLRGISIASGPMYWGLARFIGLDVHRVDDTARPGMDLCARLQWVAGHKEQYSFFHVHTKAPDQAAHTKNPRNKVAVIEALDRGLGQVLDRLLDGETMVVVTADHSTPSAGPLIHSGEPVPIMAIGPGIRRDRVKSFDEVHCAGGALGQLQGQDFMYCVLNWLDRAKLQGLMDTPADQPYWPGNRKPFRIDEGDI